MLKTPALVKTPLIPVRAFLKPLTAIEMLPAIAPTEKPPKPAIRSSLRASTIDHVFCAIFSCVTAEVLVSNFMLELGASSVEIGILAAFPTLTNFIQPLGAYFGEKTNSRRRFGLQTFAPSRLLWLFLVLGIVVCEGQMGNNHQLVQWTLAIALLAHICAALGGASWTSWMAVLVPQRLRGRYFGFRNSAASLTNLLCIPLLGLFVSTWHGGPIQGYGVVLFVAVLAGLISLGCQSLMLDVNPLSGTETEKVCLAPRSRLDSSPMTCLRDSNFLKFLLYFGLVMFAFNLSNPFFNIYLLDSLDLDISQVTLYSSLMAGANLLTLVRWGKLADRLGNRSVLLLVGIFFAATPLLWFAIGSGPLSLWLGIPFIYLLLGMTWPAIELCNINLQMAIASAQNPSNYFAIAAAVGGLGSALGAMTGGFLAQCELLGGFLGLFALSAGLRLLALLPLAFVREQQQNRELGEA